MLHTLLERHWQSPRPVLRLLLRPLSILFRAIATRRRARYLAGSLKSEKAFSGCLEVLFYGTAGRFFCCIFALAQIFLGLGVTCFVSFR